MGRFANTDKALAMELEQHEPKQDFDFTLKIEVDDIDEVTTYDIACEYFINLEERRLRRRCRPKNAKKKCCRYYSCQC